MYNNNAVFGIQSVLGDNVDAFKPKKSVFLPGANFNNEPTFKRVAPAGLALPPEIQRLQDSESIVFDCLRPMMTVLRVFGIFPIANVSKGVFRVTPALFAYSVGVFLIMLGYIAFVTWDPVEIVKSAEGRFEEAVISYLFTVYLLPIIMIPVSWFECKKLGFVLMDWSNFEKIYENVENKKLPLFSGNKPLLITLALPLLAIGIMVVNHLTMVYFRFVQVVPFCYINVVTFVVGGVWYLHCDVIGKVATIVAEDFQQALKNIGKYNCEAFISRGPSIRVAEFRSLWMLLAKITRQVGIGSCYSLTFLNLYLFLIITLTVYGLLSTLQDGFSIKDVGLCVTAAASIALLYFICDEAHYASNCVRVNFQKKLLLVELSWMNDDAQQEIQMFLRATEMNPTDMSLGGFVDVNRNLFKSLLATMVTYLVVLLQFQISIPEDVAIVAVSNSTVAPK